MSKTEGGGVKTAVVSAVATAVASALLAWLTPFWGWIAGVLTAGWKHLGASSGWPNWISYSLALISVQSLVYWAMRWRAAKADSHERFSQFNFLGARWRWGYISGTPVNLMSFCPACDSQLVFDEVAGDPYMGRSKRLRLHCERCRTVTVDAEGDLSYVLARVKREVQRLIRTGEWRIEMERQP